MLSYTAGRESRRQVLWVLMSVLLLGLVADQASKVWAMERAVEPLILVPGHVLAYSAENHGFVLGIGREHDLTGPILGVFGFLWLAWMIRSAVIDHKRWRKAEALACGLLLAGIVGNSIDRLSFGYVRDFLVTSLNPSLIFNIADLWVVLGGVILVAARIQADWTDRRQLRAGRVVDCK